MVHLQFVRGYIDQAPARVADAARVLLLLPPLLILHTPQRRQCHRSHAMRHAYFDDIVFLFRRRHFGYKCRC